MNQISEFSQTENLGTYLFVDLETGGLNPEQHAILQVAAIITDLDLKIQSYFMTYVRPHANLAVTAEALAINQLNVEDLAAAPEESDVAHLLHHFASLGDRQARFAGYNCKFDLPFLDGLWKRYDLFEPPYRVPWLDILDVARIKFELDPGFPNLKLATVAERLSIETSGAHDAGKDLMITIEVAKRLKQMPDRPGVALLESARFSQ